MYWHGLFLWSPFWVSVGLTHPGCLRRFRVRGELFAMSVLFSRCLPPWPVCGSSLPFWVWVLSPCSCLNPPMHLGFGCLTQVGFLPCSPSLAQIIKSRFNRLQPDEVAHICNPSTWEVEAGGSEIQSHPQLHAKSEANLLRSVPLPKVLEWERWVMVNDRERESNLSGCLRKSKR